MAKLSITCRNKNTSRGARRKVILQVQVNIVRIVEDQKPITVSVVRKPTETRIHGVLGSPWDNGLKIRFNTVLVCGVNVEDIREAVNFLIVGKSRFDFMRRVGVPFALGFFNKFECKLTLSCTPETM